jgi:hypothetical protein
MLGGQIALLKPAVIKKLLSTSLSLCLCGGGVAIALDKPETLTPAKAASFEASPSIAAETAAAIQGLGANPTTKQISAIVFKAVRSSPNDVLHIVNAAVRVSPATAVPEIVTAATSAVPNPWKQVAYRRLGPPDAKASSPDYKGGPDGKQARDGGRNMDFGGQQPDLSRGNGALGSSGPGMGDPGANFANGSQMTLAEAIARTAFDAQPGLSLATLQAAVDAAVLSDPATLMRKIQGPTSVAGVGDAGLSNYANEPLRTPKQPVVSR